MYKIIFFVFLTTCFSQSWSFEKESKYLKAYQQSNQVWQRLGNESMTYAKEIFKYGSIGADNEDAPHYFLWRLLPEICSSLMPNPNYVSEQPYRQFGFKYEKENSMPIGFTLSRANDKVDYYFSKAWKTDLYTQDEIINMAPGPRVGLNCAACHSGSYRFPDQRTSKIVLGMPAHTTDITKYIQFAFACTSNTKLMTAERVKAALVQHGLQLTPDGPIIKVRPSDTSILKTIDLMINGIKLGSLNVAKGLVEKSTELKKRTDYYINHVEAGVGRNDTSNPFRTLYQDADTAYYEKNPEQLYGAVDYPSIWNFNGIRGSGLDQTLPSHWDGSMENRIGRNMFAAFGLRATIETKHITNMFLVEKFLENLEPEKMDIARIDLAAAGRGRQTYNQNCAACHGYFDSTKRSFYPTQRQNLNDGTFKIHQIINDNAVPTLLGQIVPADEIKTDHYRLLAIQGANLDKLIVKYFDKDEMPKVKENYGYMNTFLDGIWLRGPYLHNGSVPTLWHLLNPEERPKSFVRGATVIDEHNVGFIWEATEIARHEPQITPTSRYSTLVKGNGNQGHLYGTTLSQANKQDLIEYMKLF